MSNEYLVELKGVGKTFGSVVALDNVDFSVRKGEIQGLLGENGAGKSTLMNILYGLYSPDKGDILIEGHKVKIASPCDSIKHGVGMVHQISTLVPEFTALENIFLGTEGNKYTLPLKEERKKIEQTSRDYGLEFPLDVKVRELPAGVKQKIEIVRALYKGAGLIILDEPTTSLVESEFQQLLKSLKSLVGKGVTFVLITHKIKEVMEACSSLTVMRKGKIQGSLTKQEISKEKLVKLMFMEKNIEVTESALPKVELPPAKLSGKPVCELKRVFVEGGEKSHGLKDISLAVYGGEIFGIASVSGNGEHELATTIINPSMLARGDILVSGKSIKNRPTLDVFKERVSYTPEDRIKEAILPDGSIKENVLLGHHAEKKFLKGNIFIDWAKVKTDAKKIINEYNVMAPDEEIEIRRLSGGNIQRVIIGRAFISPIDFLVTHNPTSGLDISTVEFIFNKLVEIRSQGGAILWINEDLDELMILSDRIGVLNNGELKGIFKREEFDKYKIGLLMIGG
ncbi:MAG TPA: ABC transporter ATP-binding protein [Spirochaetales bacterium]|nr:ABC transporter ATP-binding protein [Spirochaetales bacterium]